MRRHLRAPRGFLPGALVRTGEARFLRRPLRMLLRGKFQKSPWDSWSPFMAKKYFRTKGKLFPQLATTKERSRARGRWTRSLVVSCGACCHPEKLPILQRVFGFCLIDASTRDGCSCFFRGFTFCLVSCGTERTPLNLVGSLFLIQPRSCFFVFSSFFS